MNIPNVKVCLKGEWSIDKVEDNQDFNDGDICFSKSSNLLHSTEFVQFLKPVVRFFSIFLHSTLEILRLSYLHKCRQSIMYL